MRQHLEHLAAAFGALGLALFVSYFNTGAHAVVLNRVPSTAHHTPVQTPDAAFTPILIPEIGSATSTRGAPTPKASPVTIQAPVAPRSTQKQAVAKVPVQTPASTMEPEATLPPLLSALSGSVVNILCISHKPPLRGTSGTGVIIDSRGVILTVAHVAQSILLEETLGSDAISCTVRTGSPAHTAYYAKLMYISETWLRKNSTTLISTQPTGTGENDYALLAITASATSQPLPHSFPAIHISSAVPEVGSTVGIGSYGAQYLTNTEIRTDLLPTFLMGTVKDIFTFGTYTPDVLAILGGKAAQEGSSGGAVVDESGNLIGLITTSEISGSEATRELRVITPGHIERSYSLATGRDFSTYYLTKSPGEYVNEYASTAASLGTFLTGAIGLR